MSRIVACILVVGMLAGCSDDRDCSAPEQPDIIVSGNYRGTMTRVLVEPEDHPAANWYLDGGMLHDCYMHIGQGEGTASVTLGHFWEEFENRFEGTLEGNRIKADWVSGTWTSGEVIGSDGKFYRLTRAEEWLEGEVEDGMFSGQLTRVLSTFDWESGDPTGSFSIVEWLHFTSQ